MSDPQALIDALRAENARLTRLTRAAEQQAAREVAPMADWGKPSVTSPPSTQIVFQPGWFYDSYNAEGWWAPRSAMTADFGRGGNCEVSAFNNAYYYRGLIVAHGYLFLATTETGEWPTVAEAINEVMRVYMFGVYEWVIPLAIAVARNNGIIGVAGEVQPFDAVNRGRSLLYRRQQPWLHWHGSGGPE